MTFRRTGMALAISTLLVAALVGSGCSPHRVEPETGPYDESEVQSFLDALEVGDFVRLWLLDGTRKQGKLTCVDEELLCFGRVWIPWEQVERIEFAEDKGWAPGGKVIFVTTVIVVAAVVWLGWALSGLEDTN